jgi:fructoselysine-6-P-deglycase FrlB-like protein
MLTGLYLLADGASGSSRAKEISRLPMLIDRAISQTESLRSMIEDNAIDRFFFLGSGAMKGLADECALKMTEMALETAFSHRTLEFRHGPKATLNSTDQVVIFPAAAERQYLDTLLEEMTATGAQVVVIDSQARSYANARVTGRAIPQSAILNLQFDVFRPALYAHIGQLFAYWRAAIRDLNPDTPRHLARTVLLDV